MKEQIRKTLISKRDELQLHVREMSDSKIFKIISDWEVYQKAERIMLYSSFKSEVKTWDIINDCFDKGKEVILPKTVKAGYKILPIKINSLNELRRTGFGILEPTGDAVVEKQSLDLIIVPGVAFDREGYRIGYGAGYYDRFLEGYKGTKAGVCFDIQVVDNAFKDNHDIRMDYLITDRGIIYTGD